MLYVFVCLLDQAAFWLIFRESEWWQWRNVDGIRCHGWVCSAAHGCNAWQCSELMMPAVDSIVAGVVTSAISWTTLYFLFCAYSPQHTKQWHCRWVTVLHATIVVAMSGWSVFVQGPWPFTHPGNVSLQYYTVFQRKLCHFYFFAVFLLSIDRF